LGYLGSIRGDLVPLVPARKAFWQQVEENLKPHHLAKSERLKIETAIANRVPKSKTNSNWAALTSKQTIEWYTPPQYVELARQVMGNIDLDPASNELAQTWIKATTFYTAADDGLLKPWYGRVWLNPPYANATGWVDKAIIEYDKGNISEAVLLVKPADGASWYQRLNKRFPRCGANHRIRFMDRDGIAQPRPAHGNCFFYLGKDVSFFGEVFAQIGTITAPI
jgi:hypothetical protein